MKVIGYSLALSLLMFVINACDSNSNKQDIKQTQVTMLNEQFSTLQNELLLLRKEIADSPELETNLDNLATMSAEERMAIEGVRINYTVKKNVISHQLMSMVEEITIQKNIANENNDANLISELDKLLSEVVDLQTELGIKESKHNHH